MRTFFGLNEDYKKSIYEEFFLLKQYGNWTFFEVYNLPVLVRKWFLTRLVKEQENINQAQQQASSPVRRS